jgi:hypothetical protein
VRLTALLVSTHRATESAEAGTFDAMISVSARKSDEETAKDLLIRKRERHQVAERCRFVSIDNSP